MNILLIGDPHFKVDNALETSQLSQKTLEYVKEHQSELSFIVVMGDVLDTHEKIHIQPLCRANYFITELSKLVYTFVLIGNHDRMNNKDFLSTNHPFTAFKNHPNLKIVDKVIKYKKFIFVPYVENGRFAEALATIDFEADKQIIFAHQEFKGANLRTMVSETGDEWPSDYPLVFSGHIHCYQKVQDNLYYVGTPYQQNFYESEDKALMLLKLKEDDFEIERIRLDIIKKKIVNIKIEDLLEWQNDPKYLHKLVIEGSTKMIKKIFEDKRIKEILSADNISYKIKNIFEDKDSPKYMVKTGKSFTEMLSENIDKLTEYEKELFQSISSSSVS